LAPTKVSFGVTRSYLLDNLCCMIRLRSILLFLPLGLFLAGCSDSPPPPSAENVDSNGQPVSSVPWNKPESWETTGQLGGMTQ